ncbi:MAG: Ig-like domain-containing protein, partial [Desulfuromonadaceae bacterium]
MDNASVSLTENASAGLIPGADANATDVDIPAATLSYSLTGTIPVDGSGKSLFSIDSSTGEISLTAEGAVFIDYEGTKIYTLSVISSDGLSDSNIKTITINLTDVNDNAPVITTSATHSVAENSNFSVKLTSTDADTVGTNPATFTIVGGADKNLFAIDGSGNLTLAAQNYEAPADSNGNNTYEVSVRAHDGVNSTDQTITISVTNIEDQTPVIVPLQSYSYVENQTAPVVIATVAATDDVGVTGYRFNIGFDTDGDPGTPSDPSISADGFFAISSSGQISLTDAGILAKSNHFITGENIFTYGIEASDAAGNWSAPVDVKLNLVDVDSIAGDTTPPTVESFTISDTALKIGETATVTITFNEAVTGFTNADLDLSAANGTLSPISTADGGNTWTATFTPTVNTDDLSALTTNSIITLNGSYTDLANNAGPVGATISYDVDTLAPVPAITSVADITIDNTINIAEAAGPVTITGTVGGDATEGNLVTLTLTNANYTGTFTGVVAADMTFSIPVAGSALVADVDTVIQATITTSDAAGNLGTGTATKDYDIDLTPPVPTITLDANITADDIISIAEASGNIAITGTVSGDAKVGDWVTLTVNNKLFTGQVQSGMTFSIPVTGADLVADTDKVINASVTTYDTAGNPGMATDSDGEGYSVDTGRPTATIVVYNDKLNIGGSSVVNIIFSEKVTNFDNSDLIVGNGTLSTVSSLDGGITWATVLSPDPSVEDSTNVITLKDASVYDTAGNANSGTKDSNNYAIDTIAPAVTITDDEGGIGNIAGGTITYTITFTEAVTGFSAADITVVNGLKGDFTAISATEYTLVVTPDAGKEGDITIDVAAGMAFDTNGNPNTAATQAVQAFDTLA